MWCFITIIIYLFLFLFLFSWKGFNETSISGSYIQVFVIDTFYYHYLIYDLLSRILSLFGNSLENTYRHLFSHFFHAFLTLPLCGNVPWKINCNDLSQEVRLFKLDPSNNNVYNDLINKICESYDRHVELSMTSFNHYKI